MSGMKFSVDPWDVDYGTSMGIEDDASSAQVVVELERPADEWSAVTPANGAGAGPVLFVDGVRRIDARVWIEEDGDAHPGICSSYAAGAVRCDGRAELVALLVERGVFSAAPTAADITTISATYPARMTASPELAQLMRAVHERMARAEVAIAEEARRDESIDLVVIDGPLRGRQHIHDAIGFIKSHEVAYLPPDLHRLVGTLAPGQRTPVFTIGTSFSRHSWYLRLPGPVASPWAGIVRCECSSDVLPTDAVALADATCAVLPRFASEPHKDPRAPQNLYPIGGLERDLRHRLGDPRLLFRALRRAAANGTAA
jgi:hypothetical protein